MKMKIFATSKRIIAIKTILKSCNFMNVLATTLIMNDELATSPVLTVFRSGWIPFSFGWICNPAARMGNSRHIEDVMRVEDLQMC